MNLVYTYTRSVRHVCGETVPYFPLSSLLRDRTTQGKARCLSNIAFAQVHHGGPAHLAGNIATGDYIEEVNRTPILRISDAAAKLKGPTSTLVEVKVRQGGGGDSAYVHLLRQKVDTGDQNNYPIGIAAALRVVHDGVEVDRVIEGGPAWLSGMKEGSVITAIDGKPNRSLPQSTLLGPTIINQQLLQKNTWSL